MSKLICGKFTVGENYNSTHDSLWHGANWTFVIWGLLNGLYQIIGDMLVPFRNKIVTLLKMDRNSISHRIMKVMITFTLFDFTAIFFRSDSISDAKEIISSIISTNNLWILYDGSLYNCGLDRRNFMLMVYSIILLFVADYCKYREICIREVIIKQEWWFRIALMSVSILLILLVGIWGSAYNEAGFIYFQF